VERLSVGEVLPGAPRNCLSSVGSSPHLAGDPHVRHHRDGHRKRRHRAWQRAFVHRSGERRHRVAVIGSAR